MILDINEFYQINKINDSFDELLYQKAYPETEAFYQPIEDEKTISYSTMESILDYTKQI